jgi:protein-tyrosine phosphatase
MDPLLGNSVTQEQQPILDSYWVITGRFRAGEYPGSTQDEEARKKVRWLLTQGTNMVLDLTEAGEPGLKPYAHLLHEEADNMDKLVLYKRMPIRDFSTPSHEAMVNTLDVIDGAIADGKNIYLHCKGGLGRTGMTVGCYLVRHGLPVSDVFDMICQMRKDTPHKGSQSPETETQRRMVMEWKKGQ